MNTMQLCAVGTLVLAAVSVRATAQLAPAQPMSPLHVPIHTAADDQGVAYGIWGAAESYKASFHDGMTFVPYLGGDYPHNQPWSWRTKSVTVGGTSLFEASAVPETVQREYRYEYRFPGVTEAYDVRLDGLEQTFVVHQLPARGDLVITGEVTSALRSPACEAAQQPLTFVDDRGTPIVGYGAAWAIDGHGARTPVTTSHRDGRIVLTVPGDWLAGAALPIVVDPLLTRHQIAIGFGGAIRTVDIGRESEAGANNVLVVSVYAASQFDDDIYARLCNDDYSLDTIVFYDTSSSWDSDGAACAFVAGVNRWALVFRRYFALNPVRVSVLRCHVHGSADTLPSTTVAGLATAVGDNDWRPDIGGVQSFATGAHALVVFQREDNGNTAGHWADIADSAAWGVLFDAAAINGSFGVPFPIAANSQFDHERPRVNQVAEGGSSFSWVCTYQTYANGTAGDDWDVFAVRIDNHGVKAAVTWHTDIGSLNTRHQLAPVVEGMYGRYAIAYATETLAALPQKNGAIRGTALRVQRIDWPHGAAVVSGYHPSVQVHSGPDRIYETSCIAYDTNDDSHFVIGGRTTSTAVPSAFCMRVGFRGEVTEAFTYLYSVAGDSVSAPACAFADDGNAFLFAYGVANGGTEPTYGHTMTYVAAPPVFEVGFGCSSASIGWSGNRQIGAEFDQLGVVGAEPTSLHIMLASLATIDAPITLPGVDPGCRMLVDAFGPGFIGILAANVGVEVSWTIPLFEHFTPTTLYFQDWLLDGGQLSSTRRIDVAIVK